MKKLLAFFILMTSTFLVKAQNTNQATSIKNVVLQVLQEQQAAWNKGDLTTFMQGYWKNDSVAFVGSESITYGWQQTMDNYKKRYQDKAAMGELNFSDIKIDQLSDVSCFVTGAWHLKREIGDVGGHYTLLFKKINGQWLIVTDHSS